MPARSPARSSVSPGRAFESAVRCRRARWWPWRDLSRSAAQFEPRHHRQPTVVAARPEVDGGAAVEAAAELERVDVEQRLHRLEGEAPDDQARALPPRLVDQQGGDQRPVDDQPRIALDLGDVAAVVVDAVAVEGERRVAEQQHRIGRHRPCGRLVGRRAAPAGARRARLRQVAVDDVVLLGEQQLAVARDLVAHGDEHQGAGLALAPAHVGDGRGAGQRIADPDRR